MKHFLIVEQYFISGRNSRRAEAPRGVGRTEEPAPLLFELSGLADVARGVSLTGRNGLSHCLIKIIPMRKSLKGGRAILGIFIFGESGAVWSFFGLWRVLAYRMFRDPIFAK